MQKLPPSLETIHKYFRYDIETGKFYWKKIIRAYGWKIINARIGDEAGSYHPKQGVMLMVNGERWLAHRIVWYIHTGEWGPRLSHKNGDKTDNRYVNLQRLKK